MVPLSQIFTDALPGNLSVNNMPAQVFNACYSITHPKGMKNSEMVIYNPELAIDLGMHEDFCGSKAFCDLMAGNTLFAGSKPFAMCYGGHQFGQWAGQLGDGRAINLGEVILPDGFHQNLQLKGAGPTPYSRSADGFAVLRSSIREYLCSEAMYYLRVPTTRALALVLTGEEVLRDVLYNGNAAYEKGAIVCRVAPTFIRFGNFEIFTARQDLFTLKKLTDFTIQHYYPQCLDSEDKYLHFFRTVCEKTCEMIVHWQRVGFVHGVMNTDNMSIIGQTIDYGPYGWLDDYNSNWTPNTTDAPTKRYRFGNQPVIAQWNLLMLANALFPLIKDTDSLSSIVEDFRWNYQANYLAMMKEKTGLYGENAGDDQLITDLENLLISAETDMTIFFRQLALIHHDSDVETCYQLIKPAFYSENNTKDYIAAFSTWFSRYTSRLKVESPKLPDRKIRMDLVNPRYVLRNYMVQLAIDRAEKKDYSLIYELFDVLKNPYLDQPEYDHWYSKRPDWAKDKIGCSMLSCSS